MFEYGVLITYLYIMEAGSLLCRPFVSGPSQKNYNDLSLSNCILFQEQYPSLV